MDYSHPRHDYSLDNRPSSSSFRSYHHHHHSSSSRSMGASLAAQQQQQQIVPSIAPTQAQDRTPPPPPPPSLLPDDSAPRRNAAALSSSPPLGYGSFHYPERASSFSTKSLSASMRFTDRYLQRKDEDPEAKRRRRVASYKALGTEGRLKSSIQRSFRWMKKKFEEMRYGMW